MLFRDKNVGYSEIPSLTKGTTMSNTRHPENPSLVVETETPEATVPPRASLTITEPKFVYNTRHFVKRHALKAGLVVAGAAAGAAAIVLTSKGDDDEVPEVVMNQDGDLMELESNGDIPVYVDPTIETSTTEN